MINTHGNWRISNSKYQPGATCAQCGANLTPESCPNRYCSDNARSKARKSYADKQYSRRLPGKVVAVWEGDDE